MVRYRLHHQWSRKESVYGLGQVMKGSRCPSSPRNGSSQLPHLGNGSSNRLCAFMLKRGPLPISRPTWLSEQASLPGVPNVATLDGCRRQKLRQSKPP